MTADLLKKKQEKSSLFLSINYKLYFLTFFVSVHTATLGVNLLT